MTFRDLKLNFAPLPDWRASPGGLAEGMLGLDGQNQAKTERLARIGGGGGKMYYCHDIHLAPFEDAVKRS